MNNQTSVAPETVGRKYTLTNWGVLSRRVGGDGKWYGRDNYKTEAEAMAAFNDGMKASRYQDVGGITVDFGPAIDQYERKVVRVTKECEVIKVGTGKV